jgi:hypothetical protein
MAEIREINQLNMILVTEWNGGMQSKEICKIYKVQPWRLKSAINEYFTTRTALILKIKAESKIPDIEPKILEIENVICASFANLTVGDVLFNNGKIQALKFN